MTLYEIGFPADFCDWSATVPRQVTGSINAEGAMGACLFTTYYMEIVVVFPLLTLRMTSFSSTSYHVFHSPGCSLRLV